MVKLLTHLLLQVLHGAVVHQLLHPQVHHKHLGGVQLLGFVVVGQLPDVRGNQGEEHYQVLQLVAIEVTEIRSRDQQQLLTTTITLMEPRKAPMQPISAARIRAPAMPSWMNFSRCSVEPSSNFCHS